jgi:hypothetical protein
MGKERLLNSLQLMGGAHYLSAPDYFHKSPSCDKEGRPVEKRARSAEPKSCCLPKKEKEVALLS